MEVTIAYLGIDVGGTKVALRAEADGLAPYQRSVVWGCDGDGDDGDRDRDVAGDLDQLRSEVEALRRRWPAEITRVGVAMPATIDGDGLVTAWPGRPSWAGTDLRAVLRSLFPDSRTGVADDGDLAALAEARHSDLADVVYLGVGTGVGGGVVLAGRACPGWDRGSCEIGHMIIDGGSRSDCGSRCDCGRRGCLQSVASGPATLRRAGALRGAAVDVAALRAGLRDSAGWAVAAVGRSCAALAAAVVSVGELLRPSVAFVGGGFAAALPDLVPLVAEHTLALARPGHPPPAVRPARLGGLSSLHGAVLLARSLAGTPVVVDPATPVDGAPVVPPENAENTVTTPKNDMATPENNVATERHGNAREGMARETT